MSSDSDTSASGSEEIVSENIRKVAKNVSLDLLPKRSKQLYTAAYNAFKKWRRANGTNSFCEDVLLAYFFDMSKKYASSTLWSTYSMLRTTINTFDHVDISKHQKLIAFLKKQHSGYKAKKSSVFTKEQISKFLNEAPNDVHLSRKVALIFGIAGALRRIEYTKLLVTDIKETEDWLLVQINETKNKVPRSFTITGGLYDICKLYMQARPQPCLLDRFFLKYSNGKCINQAIGINKFGSMPKEVAEYLNLPNAETYTGHSFRRTSATLLVDAGADITTLKRHGGWKSNTVAEGYISDSLNNKKKICQQITSGIVLNKQVTIINSEQESETISSSVDVIHRVRSPVPTCNELETVSINNNCTSATTSTATTSIQQVNNKQISNINTPSASTNINSIRSRTLITKSSVVRKQVESSNHQQQTEECNKNISITNGSVSVNSSSTKEAQKEEKFTVFYDADVGLYIYNPFHTDSKKSYVFTNCNVSVQGAPDQPLVFNNCNITYSSASINDVN